MKRVKLAIMLAVIGMMLPQMVLADSFNKYGVYYETSGNEATVTYGKNEGSYFGSVVIPSTVSYGGSTYKVTGIGRRAFYKSYLLSITIGSNVKSIDEQAFLECNRPTYITVESGNKWYDSRGNCNAIIKTATNALILGGKKTIIPNSVTSIGNDAFEDCTDLYSITIPNSVKSIGDNAFNGCSSLTSVTIGNSVNSIGWYAFNGCSGLTSVTIPNSVTSIREAAFRNCSKLKKIYTGKNVEIIPESCFENCTSLETLIIGESARKIEVYAFKGCERITQIHSHNYIPPTCATGFSEYVYKAAVVHVPNTHNAVARYQADKTWSKFFEIYDEDITGVEATSVNTTAPSSLINLNGQYISNAQRGINLQKMPDGTTKKVLMR